MPQWCLCLKPGGLLYHTDQITGFIRSAQPRSCVLASPNTCFLENFFPHVVLSLLCWNNSKATQGNWGDFSVSGYGHLSSMSKLIPLFGCGTLLFHSSWGRVLPQFSAGTCPLPTPWFKCFPRSCPWPSSLFFCPLSLDNLLQSPVSNNCHIKDSQLYTHKSPFCIPFIYVPIYILWNSRC